MTAGSFAATVPPVSFAADKDVAPLTQVSAIDEAKTSGSTGVVTAVEPEAGGVSEAEPAASGKLTVPIAVVLLFGAVLLFFTSPAYSRLYWSVYGPPDEY